MCTAQAPLLQLGSWEIQSSARVRSIQRDILIDYCVSALDGAGHCPPHFLSTARWQAGWVRLATHSVFFPLAGAQASAAQRAPSVPFISPVCPQLSAPSSLPPRHGVLAIFPAPLSP
jgi:hypothetical protein